MDIGKNQKEQSSFTIENPFAFYEKDFSNKCFDNIKENTTEVKKIKNDGIEYLYLSNKPKGFSLSFKENKLYSIFYYNNNIHHFNIFKGNLPYSINIEKMKIINIVEYLGDTPKKGGGKYPIYLSYPFLGIEFTFLNFNWNDKDNPIVYISLFQKSQNELYCATCTKVINTNDIHCDNKCGCVLYCSLKCKYIHIKKHLNYCMHK